MIGGRTKNIQLKNWDMHSRPIPTHLGIVKAANDLFRFVRQRTVLRDHRLTRLDPTVAYGRKDWTSYSCRLSIWVALQMLHGMTCPVGVYIYIYTGIYMIMSVILYLCKYAEAYCVDSDMCGKQRWTWLKASTNRAGFVDHSIVKSVFQLPKPTAEKRWPFQMPSACPTSSSWRYFPCDPQWSWSWSYQNKRHLRCCWWHRRWDHDHPGVGSRASDLWGQWSLHPCRYLHDDTAAHILTERPILAADSGMGDQLQQWKPQTSSNQLDQKDNSK